ncbi:MAG: glycosyltransferase family 2 protein [Ferrimicrobium sp.]|uniref:Glycosyltransferase family 2 protein n=1 Tax=Ferrimicrobium acidiphilum TaxID=121039 RepID=A0ABV3Y4V4_9ACTN|nr:glycosyltransferase [Ferrimicrobium sp.]
MVFHDLALLVASSAVGVIVFLLIVSSGKGDLGNGVRHVILPKPETRLGRVFAFIAFVLAWSVFIALDYREVTVPIRWFLYRILAFASVSHLDAVSYVSNVDPLLFLLILGGLLALQVTRAHTRFSLLAGSGIIVVYAVGGPIVTGLILAVASLVFVPTDVVYFLFDLVTLVLGFTSLMGLIFGTTFLPRRYRFSAKVSSLRGAALLMLIAIVVVVIAGASLHLVGAWSLKELPASGLIVFLMIPTLFSIFEIVLLLIRGKEQPGQARDSLPAIDVIMPAFNEEVAIADTVFAIDRAAVFYGGVVRLFVADDGSSDRTIEVIRSAAAMTRSLEVQVITGGHVGKAGALNRALAATSAELAVRIDADILVDERVFVNLPRWFANPGVGCVGAFDLPNPDLPAWYTKGRLFECLMTFGFTRLAYERLDGNNIPGTFMAFRREEALAVGGFVEGMNGEDSDLTFNLGRLGLVSVIDRAIVIYEDVPQTFSSFIEQRTRWSRASFHVASRHFPVAANDITPRYLVQLRFLFNKLSALMRPITYVSAAVFFILVPHYGFSPLRAVVLLAIGLVPQYLVLLVVTLYYGFWREIPFLVVWLPFTIVRKIGLLSGLFSLPPYQRSQFAFDVVDEEGLVGVGHER